MSLESATILLLNLLLLPLASSNAITTAPEFRPALLRRQSIANTGPATSCVPWLNIENSCAIANPSFTLLTAFVSQAPCLCYSSSTWAPDVYDSALATCLAYLSTASPAYYTSIDGPSLTRTPCLEVASVVGPATGGFPSVTTLTDPNYLACLSWQAIVSSCYASTPGFGILPISTKNSCLCYTSGTYAPSVFDDYWDSCLTYFSTADPVYYSTSQSGNVAPRSPCALNQTASIAAAPTSLQTASASVTSGGLASSGAGVTSLGPSSTSIVLMTTAPTATSAGGNSATVSSGEVSIAALLTVMGTLVVALVL